MTNNSFAQFATTQSKQDPSPIKGNNKSAYFTTLDVNSTKIPRLDIQQNAKNKFSRKIDLSNVKKKDLNDEDDKEMNMLRSEMKRIESEPDEIEEMR